MKEDKFEKALKSPRTLFFACLLLLIATVAVLAYMRVLVTEYKVLLLENPCSLCTTTWLNKSIM